MASYELVIYVQLAIIVILAIILFRSPQHGHQTDTNFYYGTVTPIPDVTRYYRAFQYE